MTPLSFCASGAITVVEGDRDVPTETFTNLSAEKQRRIFDAAVLEFSTRRFSEASINQIIKTAGISRGSFYQYFSDKEDLYLYVLAEIGKEKLVILSQLETLHPDADFFEIHAHMTEGAIAWARERPLFNQVGLLMELDDSEFMTRLRARTADGFAKLGALIDRDKQRGLIKTELDTAVIVEMFYALMMHVTKEYYKDGTDEAVLLKKMAEVRTILKEGIARA